MKKFTAANKILFLLIGILFINVSFSHAQCSTTNATSCVCAIGTQTDCDLLPDIKVARPPLLVMGSSGIIEYSQTGNGANNGRLRISVSTPNIGFGPLEIRTTNVFVCGTDTFTGTPPSICPDNITYPKQLINQRVYHKNGNVMSYYDRPAGTMTYHPSHGHMHVDNWGIYSLRTNNGDPNPLNWPIVGTGAKLAFCLMDYGSCSSYNGHCTDDNNNVLVNSSFPNFGLGGGSYSCSSVFQGISSGYTDIYYQSLDGMWITIPPGTCNGQYYIVVNLDPYNYFLESNDSNNVLAVPFTLTQQSGQTPTVTPSGATSLCPGNNVTLTSTTGTSYLWSTGATTQSITVNSAGQYSVTVTSGNNCIATSQPVAVSINPMSVSASSSSVSICTGDAVQLNATVTPTQYTNSPVSFSNNFVYSIPDNNATGISSPIIVSGISPATIGSSTIVSARANITHTYDGDLILYLISPSGNQIKLSNRRGGSGDNFVNTIFSPAATTAIASGSAPFTGTFLPDEAFSLLAGNVNGTWALRAADVDASDIGTINNWTLQLNTQIQNTNSFSWTSLPSGFTSSISNSSAVPSGNTTYSVTATDNMTGCTATSSVSVSVTPLPQVVVSNPAPICAGGAVTLTASGANTFSWSPATGLSATTGSSVDASPLTTTTYTVTGTTNGCTSTQTVTVNVSSSLSVSTNTPAPICPGGNATLIASGAATYSWSPTTGLSATTGSTVTASPTATTLYTITGTSGPCTASQTVLVIVNPIPVVSIAPHAAICAGGNTVLTASGATSYSWSPATGLSSTTGSSVTASPSSTTMYTVTGTTDGCSSSQTVTVNVTPSPVLSVNSPSGICQGQSTILNASGANSYSWSPATGLNSTTGNSVIASPASSTTYTVTGTTNSCSSSQTVVVTVSPVPSVSVNTPAPVCQGQGAVLTAGGASSYSWSPSTGLNATTGSSVIASPSSTIQYTVTGTTSGCSNTATTTVTINPAPVVSINGLSSSYPVNGNSINMAGNPSGGTFSGTGVSGNVFTPCAAGVGGPYSVIYSYINSSGCTGSATVNVMVTPLSSYSCITPFCLSVSNITSTSARLAWSPLVVSNKFRVRYALLNSTNYSYKNVNGGASFLQLNGLTANKTYNWWVQSQCGNNSSAFSAMGTFSTPAAGQRIETTAPDPLNIYPSVADESVTADVSSSTETMAQVLVTDISGKKLLEMAVELGKGENQFHINTKSFGTGIYLMQVQSSVQRYVGKFVVRH
jgi:subtilisin-like proprotein convertase family protein